MKKFFTSLAVVLCAICFFACSNPGPRSIESPHIDAVNNSSIDISRIELTDTATIVDIHATFRPGWWIRIDSATVLRAGGKDYALTGASDNITIGGQFTLPESGEDDFTLYFEPLPFDTKTVDFVENVPDGFMLWGVDVTGKGGKDSYADAVPRSVRDISLDEVFTEPVLEVDSTELRFHLLGYRPDYGKLTVRVTSLAGNSTLVLEPDAEGNVTATPVLYGATDIVPILEVNGGRFGSIKLAPGTPTDIWLDCAVLSDDVTKRRGGKVDEAAVRAYDNGRYAAFNRIMKTPEVSSVVRSDIPVNYRMNVADVTDALLARRAAMLDSIAVMDVPEDFKAFLAKVSDYKVLNGVISAPNRLYYEYYTEKGSFEGANDSLSVEIPDAVYKRVVSFIDPSDPALLFFNNYPDICEVDWTAHGVESPLPAQMKRFAELQENSARVGLLTPEQLAEFDGAEPFLAKALKVRNDEANENFRRLAERIKHLPEGAPERYFDDCVSQFKGKIVVVDLWNTWCGPCRGALKVNEPLKTGELSDPDIEWVYIADESSDLGQYESMIKNIKGHHFLATKEQIAAVRERFEVDGIPFYILVDRDGRAVRHPDFRDHDLMVSEVRKALGK